MERALKILRKKALKHADEAFGEHKEEIFEALRSIYEFGNLTRNSGFLAMEHVLNLWEEETGLQEGEIIDYSKYDEETLAFSLIGRKVPLIELLCYVIYRIVDARDWQCTLKEFLEQTEKSRYSGYEWFVAYLYLKGSKDIFLAEHPERFLASIRMIVPERWLEEYDRFWQPFSQKRQEEELEELAWRRERVDNSFQKAALVRTAFHRIYGQMEPEKIRRVANEVDFRTLAAGLVFAEELVRDYFLRNLTDRQQELVMEEWFGKQERYTIWDTILAMDKMVLMSGLTGR